ncbi:MAG TPA: hypothetical protein DCS13_04920 [Candidatus Margulisbacteria bacterium]|nr:MAG: hypothetical protein A2X43_00255 [Candidatus Margulisbacteria bacterium GWD2_39_127]HAR62787.1 hypothetical protein [Candidatus Margulisiibacteriota bacterium]
MLPINGNVNLEDYICLIPFTTVDLRRNGVVTTCCYINQNLGILTGNDFMQVWNSPIAREIRMDMIDGNFSFCDKAKCACFQQRNSWVVKKRDIEDSLIRDAVAKRLDCLDFGPRTISLTNDPTCNLSCPSCRKKRFTISEDEYRNLKKIHNNILHFSGEHLETLHVAGAGDPFASKVYRELLQEIEPGKYPKLKISIMTNGQLLNEKMWKSLNRIKDSVNAIGVSVDAVTELTYGIVRRGGDFNNLMNNLEFVSNLEERKKGLWFGITMVVQKNNYKEMLAFVELGKQLGVDAVNFSFLSNWGTFTQEEYVAHSVHLESNPEHNQLCQILKHPIFKDKIVNLGNLYNLYLKCNIDRKEEE